MWETRVSTAVLLAAVQGWLRQKYGWLGLLFCVMQRTSRVHAQPMTPGDAGGDGGGGFMRECVRDVAAGASRASEEYGSVYGARQYSAVLRSTVQAVPQVPWFLCKTGVGASVPPSWPPQCTLNLNLQSKQRLGHS